jgi:TrmH family RNA methyltransferase
MIARNPGENNGKRIDHCPARRAGQGYAGPMSKPLTKAEVARLRSLRDKKQRDALGLFTVEGGKVVGELISAGYRFEEVYGTPEWPGAATRAITAADMGRISHFPTPSSVLAIGRVRRDPLPAGAIERGVTLVLDGLQDPGNVGTLLRIADWFAIDRVLLSPDCADPFSQKAINASMGSFARVATHTAALPAALAGIKAPVWGCDLNGEDIHSLPAPPNVVVVIGSEGRGLSPEVRKLVTRMVTIPRYGKAESLNAAAAAAIVCDHLRSRRIGM